jgi:hypothetical protein
MTWEENYLKGRTKEEVLRRLKIKLKHYRKKYGEKRVKGINNESTDNC